MRLPTAYILSHLFIMCRFRHSLCILVSFLVLAPLVPAAPVKITFSADKLQGSGGKGQTSTSLTGNAKVSVDSLNIYGERIELYGKDYRYIKASGNVTGEDAEKGFTFSAASLSYDRETEVAEFMGQAKVEDTKNKVETSAERIEYNQKNEIILLQMAVKLKSKGIACDSLFAVYNRNTSMLELTGKPTVKKGKDEFKAARISVNLDTEDIKLEGKVSGSVTEEKEEETTKTETPPKGAISSKEETKTP
ncbi:MAG: LptA/OstA family protein [Treponema sp.]|uniref:LptA/OstA family protein n=2 Tax=Treponema TaxID=157 RepID=UPI0020A271C1|nr:MULTISPECIES: LptA/OstA family protein [unclassified Treponema]